MAKILIVATQRYSINACDFDLMFRNSEHEIVRVLYHHSVAKKSWFDSGKYKHSTRNGICTRLPDLPHQSWKDHNDLRKKINDLDFDFLCLGNGNCDSGRWIQENIKAKFLFSEYGWLPWNECFYIDMKGTGPLSSLKGAHIGGVQDHHEEIERIKSKWNVGRKVEFNNYVYIPLQVDTPTSDGKPDFKFRFTPFKNNKEFLRYVQNLVPKGVKILVKNHPSCPKPTPVPSEMIDITKMRLNKLDLYKRMRAMVAINSTSVLESMLMEKCVFTYGEDIFTEVPNPRSLQGPRTFDKVNNPQQFASLLHGDPSPWALYFIRLIMDRQVCRHRCSDPDYIKGHYWTKMISAH